MTALSAAIARGTHASRPAAGTAGFLYYETDTETLFRDNGSTWDTYSNPGYLGEINVQDQKSAGTQGGGNTGGSYQTRTLNTKVTDTNSDCTLASNQMTLTAGTYDAWITVPGFGVDAHKARLRNVTDGTTVLVGTAEYSDSTTVSGVTRSVIKGRFTIAASKALEVQHFTTTTRATNGWGQKTGATEVEVYTEVVLLRVS